MTQIIPHFTMNREFAEVLSGEFKPACDPLQRSWSLLTLARLAVTDGNYETAFTDEVVEKDRISFFYTPTWVPQVEADVFGSFYDGVAVIDSLIYDEKIGEKCGAELVVSQHSNDIVHVFDTKYDVSTAAGLAIAKSAATQSAQRFFDGLAESNN